MKLPFRSRRDVDPDPDIDGENEFNSERVIDDPNDPDGYLEAYGVAPSVPAVVPVEEEDRERVAAPLPSVDHLDRLSRTAARPPGPKPPAVTDAPVDDNDGLDDGLSVTDDDASDDGLSVADDEVAVEVDATDFSNRMERIRSESKGEQRSAWAYLGLLSGMFVFLVGFGWACSDQRASEVAGNDPVDLMTGAEPASLVFRVDGDVVAVQGTVPDEAARNQLLAAAQATYGAENVVDNLEVDDGTTLEAGTVRFVGSAAFGDERPEALQSVVDSTFGLANRGFEVGFVETVLSPVNAEVAIADGMATVSGILPDEQSLTDLVAVAGEVWGSANVESSGLSVGDTTWTDGLIRLTGSSTTSDQRISDFDRLVSERIDTLVNVDASALALVDDSVRREEVQTTVDDLVAASPIQFAPNSPVIDAASDQVLIDVAEALNLIPDVNFEVVGHTDNVGNDQENQLLSEERAAAVVERLTELGVTADRMSSRGEGEDNPVADNSTTDGKAANRRIEFILVGTSEIEEPSE